MAVEIQEKVGLNYIEVDLRGKLSRDDYRQLVPGIEEQIWKHGKLRVLVYMQDFHGWTVGALWEGIKFDVKHMNDLQRIAFVGDQRWESAMSTFCKPFTSAEIRYFQPSQIEEARAWLESP